MTGHASRILLCCLLLFVPHSLSFSAPAIETDIMTKSMGADTLKEMVLTAAESDAAETMDVSGIVWLEHINLVVGSRPLAEKFIFGVLGFSADKSSSFHCNLGQQQFHLAENGDPAQRVTGSIGLVVPSVERVRQRAEEALKMEEWKDTQFKILQHKDGCTLTLTCPWGNRLHLYDATAEAESLNPTSDSPHKMVKLHAEGGTYASKRMAIRGNPGIRYIEISCPPNSVPALAQFYKEMLGCTIYSPPPPPTTTQSTSTSKETSKTVVVCVGPGVHLVYVENKNLSPEDFDAMKGVHICIYVNNFRALYERLSSRDLIWTNPRFTHLDSCDSWEEARDSRTLRFKDLIDLDTGEKVLELEHETRPMRHGQYLKVPFYDPK